MKKLVLALSLLVSPALAADLPVKAIPYLSTPCAAGSCSGWYAGFGVAGDGSNADIVGQGINGSVFAAGGILKAQGGYQFWNGNWFAALDLSLGYELITNTSATLPV